MLPDWQPKKGPPAEAETIGTKVGKRHSISTGIRVKRSNQVLRRFRPLRAVVSSDKTAFDPVPQPEFGQAY